MPYSNKKHTQNAQTLRKNATKEERHLWYDFLCSYPVRFRRQVVIRNFIVDFYCAEAELAIELDGSQHYSDEGKQYDADRTGILNNYGIKVLRFSNADVNRNFRGVCEHIDIEVQKAIKKR